MDGRSEALMHQLVSSLIFFFLGVVLLYLRVRNEKHVTLGFVQGKLGISTVR